MTLKEIFDKYGKVKVIMPSTRQIFKLLCYVNDDKHIAVEYRGVNDNFIACRNFHHELNGFSLYQTSNTTNN